MTGPQIIVLATPVFLLLIGVEFLVGLARGNNTYRLNDALNSIGLGILSLEYAWARRWLQKVKEKGEVLAQKVTGRST